MRRTFILFLLIFGLWLRVSAQNAPEAQTLVPGQPVEREIAGGQSHNYRIALQAGQFMRVVLEQKAIGLTLVLAAPDGKQVIDVNLTPAGALESLSAEAAASGDYSLKVRSGSSAVIAGSYQVRLEVREEATVQDRQRIAAERWMLEAGELQRQGGKTAEQTIGKLQQALSLWRELGDQYWAAWSLSNIGVAYYRLSRYEKAIEYTEQALAIHREVKNRAGEAQALNNLGLDYDELSRYEQAIGYYEQATAIYREVKDRAGEGRASNNLGNAYGNLGRSEKAIEYYEQATALFREVKERASEGVAFNNLGIAHKNLGHYEQAIGYYEQALAISREVKDRTSEGRALNNLGMAYSNLGRYEQAIESYQQALAISREVKNRTSEGRALDNLGIAYEKLKFYERAIGYSEQALAIRREVKDRDGQVYSLNSLARAERSQGNLPAARTYIEECLKLAESLRSDLLSPASRASLLATVQSSYQLYTDVLMNQHSADPTRGFDALALEVSERQRARSLLDLLSEAHTDMRQGVDAELIDRERMLAKQLDDKAQQLAQATRPEQTATLKQEVSQLETDLERAQAAIRKANPRYATLTRPQPLKLKEIQAQLDAVTLLLEYSLGDERSYLWAISKDSLASYELPKGELIEKDARQVYELLTERSTNKRGETVLQRQGRISQAEVRLPAAAQALSQTILAPVAAQLGNKRLVIVADGALQYIPFAMLPEPGSLDFGLRSSSNSSAQVNNPKPKDQRPKTEDQPLIVKHEVVSLPSASALAIQRSELAGRQPAPKMLAVIADPVFDRSDSRFTTPETETGDKPQTRTVNGDDARSIEHLAEKPGDKSGVTTIRMVIPRLPFTRQEANQLMALAPKGSSFSAIDFQATRATALDPALSQYRYIHIATHGLLDTERPGLSALVFSMVDADGKPQNGFLRANDIYNLKLPAELVVLSACQTGLGKDIKGEGLVGLTRGFMYAGAARVVVSLWNVNDKATADLMTKFYEKMLKQGQPPAAALRAAQVEMWKQKQWHSPYYWAAFTMQGEWR